MSKHKHLSVKDIITAVWASDSDAESYSECGDSEIESEIDFLYENDEHMGTNVDAEEPCDRKNNLSDLVSISKIVSCYCEVMFYVYIVAS